MTRRVKLKEVCREVTVGHVGPMADEYVKDGIPFLRSQNILPFRLDDSNLKYITEAFHKKLKKSALSPGDVVVVRTGYPGTACVIPDCFPVANCADLVVIRPSDEINSHYLCCIFNSAWGRSTVSGSLVGVAQQHFNIGVAKELEITLPSIGVQQRIASILSTYDDLIENNTRRIKILEQMAQMLYREWFVNFRFPGHEKVRMIESEMGPIPEGWQIRNLFEAANVTYGFPFKSKGFAEGGAGVPVIRIRDIKAHHSNTNTTESADEKYLVSNGDLLVGMDGDFHMGKWAGGRAFLNQRVVRFRPRLGISSYYLFLALQAPIHHFDSTIVGTTVAHLSDRDLRSVNLLIPSDSLLKRSTTMFDPLFRLELALKIKNSNLSTTRDLLLPKLISGEIPVEAAEDTAAEIMEATA